MRNKRGLEVTEVLIGLFIALSVLLLMWGLFGDPAKTAIIPFFKNLPNFNFTKQAVEDMGTFRYRISDQSVQYYTGIEWRNFEIYEFNKKRVESKLLSQDFIKYYFNLRKDNNIDIYVPQNGKYINKHVLVDGVFAGPLTQGKIVFSNYVIINGNEQGGEYIFNEDEKVYRGTYDGGKNIYNYVLVSDATESGNVRTSVVGWLNGILANAGKFRYYDIKDKKNPKLKINSFNVTRIGDDLVVNLNKPVGIEENGLLDVSVPKSSVSEKEYGFLETICFLKGVEEAGVTPEEVAAQAVAIGTAAGAPKVEGAIGAIPVVFEEHINYLNSAPTALPKDGTIVESLKITAGNEGPKMVPKLASPNAGVTKIIGGNSYVISESGEIIGKIGKGMNIEKIGVETASTLKTSGFKVADTAIGEGVNLAFKLADDVKYVEVAAGKILRPLEETGILVKYRGVLKFVSSNSQIFKYGVKIIGKASIVYGLVCDLETLHKFADMSLDAYTVIGDAQSSALSTDINVGHQYYIRTGKKIQTLQSELNKLDVKYKDYLSGEGQELPEIKETIGKMQKFLSAAENDNKLLGIRYNRFMINGEKRVETTGFGEITNQITEDEEKLLYLHYLNINDQLGSSKSNKPGDINNEIKAMSDYFNKYIVNLENADIEGGVEVEPFISMLNEYSVWSSPIYSLDYLIRYGVDSNTYENYIYENATKTNWYLLPKAKLIIGGEAISNVENYDLMLSISSKGKRYTFGTLKVLSDETYEIVFNSPNSFFSEIKILTSDEEYKEATRQFVLLKNSIIKGTEIYVGGVNGK